MKPLEPPPVRRLFIPEPGHTLFEADLKRAEPQIVAKESGEDALLKVFRDNIDIYKENAKWVYGKDIISSEQRQWNKSGVNACLTEDHEVLTKNGWVSITDKPDEILCWDKGNLSFHNVLGWHDTIADQEMIEWDTNSFSQKVTNNHKIPYLTVGAKGTPRRWASCRADNIKPSYSIPKAGLFIGGHKNISQDEARLWCAIHADAGKTQKNRWVFGFKKQRKVDRLCSLLEKLNISFKYVLYKDGIHNIRFYKTTLIEPWLGSYIFEWPIDALVAYVDEAPFWDGVRVDVPGSTTHARYFATGKKEQAEWFAIMVHLTNRASCIREATRSYLVSIGERPLFDCGTKPTIKHYHAIRILCPSTPTGFFMVRRNNVISITGNTDYACKAKTLAITLHCSEAKATEYIERWIHRLYPGIGEWHRRIYNQLRKTRTVRNVYGFRKYFADRLQHLLPQALAWVASSTVSVTINRGLLRIYYELPEVTPMLQIHDSVLGQVPSARVEELLPQIKELMEVEIPYKEPLVIPVTLKVSSVSWGDVKDWSDVV